MLCLDSMRNRCSAVHTLHVTENRGEWREGTTPLGRVKGKIICHDVIWRKSTGHSDRILRLFTYYDEKDAVVRMSSFLRSPTARAGVHPTELCRITIRLDSKLSALCQARLDSGEGLNTKYYGMCWVQLESDSTLQVQTYRPDSSFFH